MRLTQIESVIKKELCFFMEQLDRRDPVHERQNNELLRGATAISTVWAYLKFSNYYLNDMGQAVIE